MPKDAPGGGANEAERPIPHTRRTHPLDPMTC